MLQQIQEAVRRGPGRPYIGPKAQTQVPEEIAEVVAKEAEYRRCPKADVWREIIEVGFSAWNGDA